MPLLPNHTPSVRTKGLSAPSLRPPRNPYKSVLHMPGVHCHLYLQNTYPADYTEVHSQASALIMLFTETATHIRAQQA